MYIAYTCIRVHVSIGYVYLHSNVGFQPPWNGTEVITGMSMDSIACVPMQDRGEGVFIPEEDGADGQVICIVVHTHHTLCGTLVGSLTHLLYISLGYIHMYIAKAYTISIA